MRPITVIVDDKDALFAGEEMIARGSFGSGSWRRVAALLVAAAAASNRNAETASSDDTDREILAVHAAKIAGTLPRTSAALVRLLDRSV